MKCKICSQKSNLFLESTLFSKTQKVSYYKCVECDFIQTEEPYWLEKAYSSAITKTDIGLISRNLYNSNLVENILLHLFPNVQKCLDYAAGYGMFVRMMRDKGFDFYWQDDYCENIFSEHFVGDMSSKYDIITAFEVVEHLPEPLTTIEKLLKSSNIIFFTTELTDKVDDFDNWWYRGEISGQHISFYHTNTLNKIANMYNLHYYNFANKTLHLLTKNKINESLLSLYLHPKQTTLLNKIFKKNLQPINVQRKSLLENDYTAIINKIIK